MNEIAEILREKGLGTPGIDIFIGKLVPSPDTCIAIIHYGGETGKYIQDSKLPADERPRFQLLSRAKRYTDAQDRAALAYDALHFGRRSVEGKKLLRCEGLQSPFYLRTDDEGREIFVCNYEIHRMR